MKKWFAMKKWLVMLLVLAASCVLFAACDTQNQTADGHEHEFSEEWTYDESYHWHAAVCEHTDVVSDHRKHAYADGKCTECGATSPTLEALVSIDVGGGCYAENGRASDRDRKGHGRPDRQVPASADAHGQVRLHL